MQDKTIASLQPQTPEQWLTQLQSSGHSLKLSELLQYRNQRSLKLQRGKRVPARGRSGNQLSKLKGRGMEFDEVRHYQNGDDIRAIDWRVTARTGQTYTKLYREERERPVFFFVDFSASMHFGSQLLFKSVQAAHVAASLAWRFSYRGDRVGGLTFNQQQHAEVKPFGRDKGVLRLLHQLVRTHQHSAQTSSIGGNESTFLSNLQRLRHVVKTGAQVFLISDFHHLKERALQDLSALSQHNAVHAVILTDPMELNLPDAPLTRVEAIDDDFVREFWLGDSRTQALYNRQAKDWLMERQHLLSRARIDNVIISAAKPFSQQWGALTL